MSLYKLSEKIFELEKQGRKITRLNIGDPGLQTPKALVEAAQKAIAEGKTRYASAQGEKALVEKIAQLHNAETKNVVVTPGSKWAIYALMRLLLKEGDNIVTPTPFWSAFELMAKSFGGRAKLLKTRFEENWQFDAEALKELVDDKTKLIVINNPLNPTSTEYDQQSVKAIVELAQDKKITVLLDEAYRDLSFKHQSLASYVEGVAVTNTFSKAYCMSGWRCGYLVGSEDLVKKIVELNQITFTNVPVFTQAAALEGLRRREEITTATRTECEKRLRLAEKIFTDVPFVSPSAGFYIFLKCSDGSAVAEKALEKGIAVVPGTSFGGYKEFLRVSLSQPLEVLEPELEKLRKAIEGTG